MAAGRRVRDLQARMMRVQTKMRRATRNIEKMSKSLEAQKKAELNGAIMFQQGLRGRAQELLGPPPTAGTDPVGMTTDQQQKLSAYQYQSSMMNSNIETYSTFMKQQIEEKYEALNDLWLEPLKMEEDSLQTEKDSLESQLQIAQADYEACKKMEQADAKNLAPNYTGQG